MSTKIEQILKRTKRVFGNDVFELSGNYQKDLIKLVIYLNGVSRDVYLVKLLEDRGFIKNKQLAKGYLKFIDDIEWCVDEVYKHGIVSCKLLGKKSDNSYIKKQVLTLNHWLQFYLNQFENDYTVEELTTSIIKDIYNTLFDYSYTSIRIVNTKYFVPMVMPVLCDDIVNHIKGSKYEMEYTPKLLKLKSIFQQMRIS